jgi:hypothetical protein
MTTRHIVSGKQLETLLYACPCDTLPNGVDDDQETGEMLVGGKPISGQSTYQVWNTANERRPFGNTIDADWSVDLVE